MNLSLVTDPEFPTRGPTLCPLICNFVPTTKKKGQKGGFSGSHLNPPLVSIDYIKTYAPFNQSATWSGTHAATLTNTTLDILGSECATY